MKYQLKHSKEVSYRIKAVREDETAQGFLRISARRKYGRRVHSALEGLFIPLEIDLEDKGIRLEKCNWFFYGTKKILDVNGMAIRSEMYSEERLDTKRVKPHSQKSSEQYEIPFEEVLLVKTQRELLSEIQKRYLSDLENIEIERVEVDKSTIGLLFARFPLRLKEQAKKIGRFYQGNLDVKYSEGGRITIPQAVISFIPEWRKHVR